MKEKYQYIGGQSDSGETTRPSSQLTMAAWLSISLMLVLIVTTGVIVGLLYTDNTNLHHRLNVLEGEMLVIRDLISQVRPVRYYRLQTTV